MSDLIINSRCGEFVKPKTSLSDNLKNALEFSREIARKNSKAWYLLNKDKAFEHSRNRRARIKNSRGSFTSKEWSNLCDYYGNKCLCCGKENVKLTVDHVIPIKLGGSNTIENIQPLCDFCNKSKGTKNTDYR